MDHLGEGVEALPPRGDRVLGSGYVADGFVEGTEEQMCQNDRSALEVLHGVLPDLPFSCRQGFCGTCRIRVTHGHVDHRDRRLTATERAAGSMLPCVSRAPEGERLVLEV